MIFHTRIPFLFWLATIALTAITVPMIQAGIAIPDILIWAWGAIFIIIGLAFSNGRK